uniref:Uncharacterized protein n=1 Tax=Cacopsylla melanoneura TaxID=428564 RepID=A0A8D8WE27_9HEMI
MQRLGYENILFVHAFTGCDTTSSAFKKSKVIFCRLYLKSPDLKEAAAVFSDPSASQEDVHKAGITCFLKWYGAPTKETSLNAYRYQTFVKSVTNVKPDISSLPPTEGAARQHLYRPYHQVQQWLGNNLPPQDWGWTMKGDVLVPNQTEDPPAPQVLLQTIFCRFMKDCSSRFMKESVVVGRQCCHVTQRALIVREVA